MRYIAYCDGAFSAKSGAGEGSFAVYTLAPDEEFDVDGVHARLEERQPIYHAARFSVCSPGCVSMTNNIAEARTLQTAICWLLENGALSRDNRVHLFMDSRCVICQFTGMYQVRKGYLLTIYREIHAMLSDHAKRNNLYMPDILRLHWISGELMKRTVISH